MKLIPNPELEQFGLDRLRSIYFSEPRPGIHATQLVYCLTKSYLDTLPPPYLTRKELLLFTIGFGLEKVIIDRHADPIETDGIWCSPDFPVGDKMGELKTTRMWPKTIAEKGLSDSWIKQIKCYCKATGQLEYPLLVLHISQPELVGHMVVFTQEEIDGNWDWILGRRDVLKYFMDKQEIPTPFMFNQEWECDGCRHKGFCDEVDAL